MTDEEKAKWFDLIVEQDLQVSKGPLGKPNPDTWGGGVA